MKRLRASIVWLLLGGACGPQVVDHSPEGNLLDFNTATLEAGLGHWVPWFSSELSRTAEAARTGTRGLGIAVTAPFGWGVTIDNWPGFEAGPGLHRVSFWARASTSSGLPLSLQVRWRSAEGTDLHVETLVTPPLRSAWVQTAAALRAPEGTAHFNLELVGGEGVPGDRFEVDGVFVR